MTIVSTDNGTTKVKKGALLIDNMCLGHMTILAEPVHLFGLGTGTNTLACDPL